MLNQLGYDCVQNHFCHMEAVDPVLEVACCAKVSCVSVWGKPHPGLPHTPALSPLALSLTHSFTQTHVQYTPLPQAIQTLGEERGESWLTQDELAMGMTSNWPLCSPTQPMTTDKKKRNTSNSL